MNNIKPAMTIANHFIGYEDWVDALKTIRCIGCAKEIPIDEDQCAHCGQLDFNKQHRLKNSGLVKKAWLKEVFKLMHKVSETQNISFRLLVRQWLKHNDYRLLTRKNLNSRTQYFVFDETDFIWLRVREDFDKKN